MAEYMRVSGHEIEDCEGWENAREEVSIAEKLGADVDEAHAEINNGCVIGVGCGIVSTSGWYDIRMKDETFDWLRDHPEEFARLVLDLMQRRRVVLLSAIN